MRLSQDDLQCVQENVLIGDEDENEYDYQYKEIKEWHEGFIDYTEFVFSVEGRWFRGITSFHPDHGLLDEIVECDEVEPYQVVVTRYRIKGEKS